MECFEFQDISQTFKTPIYWTVNLDLNFDLRLDLKFGLRLRLEFDLMFDLGLSLGWKTKQGVHPLKSQELGLRYSCFCFSCFLWRTIRRSLIWIFYIQFGWWWRILVVLESTLGLILFESFCGNRILLCLWSSVLLEMWTLTNAEARKVSNKFLPMFDRICELFCFLFFVFCFFFLFKFASLGGIMMVIGYFHWPVFAFCTFFFFLFFFEKKNKIKNLKNKKK